jgi:hypothetical protein
VQAIKANNQRNLIKSETGQYIQWNQELRFPDMINYPKRNPDFFNRENSKRKSDIWYYTNVKKRSLTESNLNIAEVTIPENDEIIYPENVAKNSDTRYVHALFNSTDVEVSALGNVRLKKVDKYKPIDDEAKIWLQENLEKIRIKHTVSNINVNYNYCYF